MKINYLIATLFLLAGIQFTSNAQLRLGAGLAYGTDVEKLGLQFRGVYTLTDPWRAAADFITYFDGVSDLSVWELNLNAHYAFIYDEKKTVYALGGLNYLKYNYAANSGFGDNSDAGLNLGAGLEIPITPTLEFYAEGRLVLGGFSQFLFSGGVQYFIGNK